MAEEEGRKERGRGGGSTSGQEFSKLSGAMTPKLKAGSDTAEATICRLCIAQEYFLDLHSTWFSLLRVFAIA